LASDGIEVNCKTWRVLDGLADCFSYVASISDSIGGSGVANVTLSAMTFDITNNAQTTVRFRMSHAGSSNFVPIPSLPLENSNLAVSLLPVKVVLSFLCFSYSLVNLLNSARKCLVCKTKIDQLRVKNHFCGRKYPFYGSIAQRVAGQLAVQPPAPKIVLVASWAY
jgi:hypothetical protein